MSLLPQGLMDLTWLRVSTRLQSHPRIRQRWMHAAAVAYKVQPEISDAAAFDTTHEHDIQASGVMPADRSLYARRKQSRVVSISRSGNLLEQRRNRGHEQMSQLDMMVEGLKGVAGMEEAAGISHWDDYQPTFSENELLDVYQDLLDITPEDSTSSISQHPSVEEDNNLIWNLAKRLLAHPGESNNALNPPESNLEEPSLDPESSSNFLHPFRSFAKPYHVVLSRLVEAVGESGSGGGVSSESRRSLLPTLSEWSSLIRVCVRENDGESAESVLTLMKACSGPPEELSEYTTHVLEFYARSGNVARAESLISNFITGPPNHAQRHLHIKAHLRSISSETIPLNALTILHQYENRNLAPPMKTYASLITSLFSVPSSIAKAQAWDLFAHMRYVAHPDPDVYIYSIMIRACASSPASGGRGISEPERALDLWTEMTVDKGIQPTRDAYNAVILACARSGEKRFVNEAFRLAREMLDGYRDSHGLCVFKPNGDLFAALLDGAKRLGDLGRVRWILAEMVKAVVDQRTGRDGYGMEVDGVELNERVMIHVFHAYASYEVPFKREQTLLVKEVNVEKEVSKPSPDPSSQQYTEDVDISESDHGPRFSSLPPQTRSGILAEARNLFDGIVQDNIAEEDSSVAEEAPRIFKDVRITAPLLNSYLSVYYRHARLSVGRDLYRSIFEDHGVERNVHSYVETLEMCTFTSKDTRELALKFAQEIWRDWERWMQARGELQPPSPRLVERTHVALMRVYALNGQLDLALGHLKTFVQRYPPGILAKPATNTKMPIRSTRTALRTDSSSSAAPRPLVRFTSATDVADDMVPPFVTFSDLELLHHRLVATNRTKDIKYVKWVCMSYSGALRSRRDQTLKQGVAS